MSSSIPLRPLAWRLTTCPALIDFEEGTADGRPRLIGLSEDESVLVDLIATSDGSLARVTILGAPGSPWRDVVACVAQHVCEDPERAVAWLEGAAKAVLQGKQTRVTRRIGGVRWWVSRAEMGGERHVMVKAEAGRE